MLIGNGTRNAVVRVEPLALSCSPGDLIGPLADQPDPAALHSAALHEAYGRYCLLACRPLTVLQLVDDRLTDSAGRVLAEGRDGAIWPALAAAFGAVRAPRPSGLGYVPGWIGYIGYEVGRHVERLPGRAVRDTALPDLRLAFYDAALLHDALANRWHLVSLEMDNPPPDAGLAREALLAVARQAAPRSGEPAARTTEQADPAERELPPGVTSNFRPDDYRDAVARCIEYIAAGDIFQVNLSQRLTVPDAPPAVDVYRCLARRNPAWYAAFLSFDTPSRPCAILSSSPELFLRVRDAHVVTRPIKGTRPRVGRADVDNAAARDLLASPKDNAELAMIIDLLRNDIGRVCRFGSVHVTDPRAIETHPTVFHLVGTVEGDLREGVGPAELLRATFPGGSITGAPKIRSMEIIDELEGLARGVYTGCIGTVGVDGSAEWNIAIRTLVRDGDRIHLQVGGGIVADSSPDGEYRETLDKARAMLEAVQQAALAARDERAA